ncbi:peroxisomal sarcosine oxidase isoform X3 [Betta splendens]|uniref:Peroxisomal sarcosine oxidase n=1 Tax=Betta splendens TaxID=158456 RepID=A0A9W2Y8A7_BETSP|nr:peroxisomal sarcosine oxidase isoform X3 [Betta splendens]
MAAVQEYDCIVIGAGVQGSFTAHQLAKNNKNTLLLEQFILPHTRGSSHGQTRIIRKAYEQNIYTHMMEECYKLWAQLETDAGVQLYRQTGLLLMGPQNNHSYKQFKKNLQNNKVPMVLLNNDIFSQQIPYMNLPDGYEALVDLTAGVLYADRAIKAVQEQFQKLGGVIRDKEMVTDIKPGPVVTVSTSACVYRTKSIVITAGPWANKLLTHTGLQLPLQVVKINVCYWKEKVPSLYSLKQGFPCFILTEGEDSNHDIYGLPSNEYPGLVKICYHMGKETDPDQRDKQTDRSDIDILQRFIRRCLPGLVPEPAVVESCMYTEGEHAHLYSMHVNESAQPQSE